MTNLKKVLLFTSFFLVLTSCNKEETADCCTNFNTNFEMSLYDTKGNNLLDPKHKNSYKHTAISLYKTDKAGKKTTIQERNLVISSGGQYFLNIVELGTATTENRRVSYLKLNDKETDKIEVETYQNANSVHIAKIWYNDKLVQDRKANNSSTRIKIVK